MARKAVAVAVMVTKITQPGAEFAQTTTFTSSVAPWSLGRFVYHSSNDRTDLPTLGWVPRPPPAGPQFSRAAHTHTHRQTSLVGRPPVAPTESRVAAPFSGSRSISARSRDADHRGISLHESERARQHHGIWSRQKWQAGPHTARRSRRSRSVTTSHCGFSEADVGAHTSRYKKKSRHRRKPDRDLPDARLPQCVGPPSCVPCRRQL